MGVTLERVQNKFACIIGELCNEPYVLSQFAIWVDLRISEYKANGNISLDCTGTSDSPVWLIGLNPPTPVQSEHALHRHPRVSANRDDRLGQLGFSNSPDFSNYKTERSDFQSEESDVVTVKEEPDDTCKKDIFPVRLHRHDGLASSKFQNTTTRKRLTPDLKNTENSMSRNKLQRLSGDIHIDSVITKDTTQENQSLMSVIGVVDHDSEVVDIQSENQPSANSALDYENSADDTFDISSFSLGQAVSDHPQPVQTEAVTLVTDEEKSRAGESWNQAQSYLPWPAHSGGESTPSSGHKQEREGGPLEYEPNMIESRSVINPGYRTYTDNTASHNSLHALEQRVRWSDRMSVVKPNSTKKNTDSAVKSLKSFLKTVNEFREIYKIQPEVLDGHLAQFFSTITRKNGLDYHPSSLMSLRKFLDFHLKENGYPFSITTSSNFLKCQHSFKIKYHELMEKLNRIKNPDTICIL